MWDYLRYPLLVLLWAVTLMSGILAILREALTIYRPNETHPRSLFWNSIVIAFVISSGILWVIEHQKVAEQQHLRVEAETKLDGLTRPQLSGRVEFAWRGDSAEVGGCIVLLNVLIKNDGAPSVASAWHLSVKSASLNITRPPAIIPDGFTVSQGWETVCGVPMQTIASKRELRIPQFRRVFLQGDG